MALFTPGSTRCSICRGVLNEKDSKIVIDPPTVGDGHPLREFVDSLAHRECFDRWEHRDEVLKLYKLKLVWTGEEWKWIDPEDGIQEGWFVVNPDR